MNHLRKALKTKEFPNKTKIKELIADIEKVNNLTAFKILKKLQGFSTYYRIRFGNYRLGFELIDNTTIS